MDLFTELPPQEGISHATLCGYVVHVAYRPRTSYTVNIPYYWVAPQGPEDVCFALVPDDYLRGMSLLRDLILLGALPPHWRPPDRTSPWPGLDADANPIPRKVTT